MQWFYDWLYRPSDYIKERWYFWIKFMIIGVGIILLLDEIATKYGVDLIFEGILIGLAVILVLVGRFWKRQERKEWWYRWWQGKENKWAIMWHI